MNHEENHKLAEPPDASSAGAQAEQGTPESAAREETASPLPRVEYSESAVAAVRQTEICQEEEKAVPLPQFDNPETTEAEQQQIGRDEIPLSLVAREPESSGSTPSVAAEPVPAPKANNFLREQNPQMIEVAPHVLRH